MIDSETNDKSCLFLSKYRLIRVPCSFTVRTRQSTIYWEKGEKVKVDRVIDWDNSTILFQVQGRFFSHRFFEVLISKI